VNPPTGTRRISSIGIVAGCEYEGCQRRSRIVMVVMFEEDDEGDVKAGDLAVSFLCNKHAAEFLAANPRIAEGS
jgi:hypothetical protein